MTAEQEWKGKVKNDEDEDVQLPSSLSIQAEWDKPLIQQKYESLLASSETVSGS